MSILPQRSTRGIAAVASLIAVLLVPSLEGADPSYHATIEEWRRQREARLRADDGWLTVAGLFWLKEGANRAGSGASNEIVLPPPAPGRMGTFLLRDGKVTFTAERGVPVTANGKPISTLQMRPEAAGVRDVIMVGDLSMFVIEHGKRLAIRLKDKNSKFRREFTGLHWFPVNEAYHVTARFVPYHPPKQIPVLDILGDTEQRTCPGYAVFKIADKECRLEPVLEDGRLFFIFHDLTSGKETYPPGRFLYADPPEGGKLVLDFNKAYNPPCSFTPYTTCPLPPRQNHLPVRIAAGEMKYHP